MCIPKDANPDKLLDACNGYDTRIARRIRHDEFYDKVVLPADEPLEAKLQKKREAEAKPAESETEATSHGPVLRRRRRTRPRVATKVLHLRRKMRRNEKLLPAGKKHEQCIIRSLRGFVI
jgi:poly-gamma-glutamate capsule biosynthesis protein CapA/YwtB (metallophosphatase superfamily)